MYTCKYFQNIYCMCVYLYMHNKYTQYTRKQKLLFWMRLIAIKRLTALQNHFPQFTILSDLY